MFQIKSTSICWIPEVIWYSKTVACKCLLQDSDRELFIFSDGMFRFEKNEWRKKMKLAVTYENGGCH